MNMDLRKHLEAIRRHRKALQEQLDVLDEIERGLTHLYAGTLLRKPDGEQVDPL